MSWEDQGRQYHQWFGNGKAPPRLPDVAAAGGTKLDLATADRRAAIVVGTLIAHFAPADRQAAALQPDGQAAADLTKAMTVWVRATARSPAAFDNTLPVGTSGAVGSSLLAATTATLAAHDRATIDAAGAALALAVRTVGVERLPRFAASAAEAAGKAEAGGGQAVSVPSAGHGPYVDPDPRRWLGHPSVGSGECVPLVERATGAPLDAHWRQGARVQGNMSIAPGTAIATFDNDGRYGNHTNHTSHAAIYLGQDSRGITVIDQYNVHRSGRLTSHKPPSERTLRFGRNQGPISDRGEYFYVVN